jgi:hypothetical protein
MSLILLLIILIVLFGGGGFYWGGPAWGGGLGGILVIILIVLLLTGRLQRDRPRRPKSVSKRTKDTLRSAHARAEMLRAIMGLRQGRDFISDYLARCHINAPSFSVEPLRMAFLEGERNIGFTDTCGHNLRSA